MRTPFRLVVANLVLLLAGCSSGMTVVRQPPPPPRPVRVVVEPLEVDIARPHNGKLYIQTNRPAYVAIFDITPGRGVALVYPVSARQRRFVMSGLREVPAWWESSRVTYHATGIGPRRSEPGRYIYALASDRPLRIPDEAFSNDYLHASLGARAYRAANPYATMRALARQFLPPVAEESWAEDAYGLSRSYRTERYRVTRVYCRDGSVYEVPAEFADRVWCGARSRGGITGAGRVYDGDLTSEERPLRPDSIVGDNGRRLAVRARGANGQGGFKRVQEPPGWENRPNGEDERVGDPRTAGNAEKATKDETPSAGEKSNGAEKADKAAKPNAESADDAKSQEKPQSSSDKRGEPEKGRGRPNGSDDKSREKKSNQVPD